MPLFRQFILLSLTVVLGLTTRPLCAVEQPGQQTSGQQASRQQASERYTAAAESYAAADWQQAVDQFRSFVAEHADDEDAQRGRFFLGEALVQLGRHADASVQFKQFLAGDANSEDANSELKAKATFRLGEAYFLGGRLDQAAPQLSTFMATWPDDPMAEYAMMYLGEIALEGGDSDAAQRRFVGQLASYPEGLLRHDVRLALARTYETQQRGEDAIAQYRRVADQGNTEQVATALVDMASLHLRQLQFAEAVAAAARFDGDLANHRFAARARLTAGWAEFQQGNLDAARANFERLLKDDALTGDNLTGDEPSEDGNTIDASFGLAMVAAETGDDAGIIAALDGLQVDASHRLAVTISYQRADALRRVGNAAAALVEFDQLLVTWPDDQLAARSQAAALECLLALERYDELQRRAQQYLDANADVAGTNVRRLLAEALAQQGEHDAAADVLGQLVEGDGPAFVSSDDRYRLAMLRFKAGDHDEALRLVEQMTAAPDDRTEVPGDAGAMPDRRALIRQLHVAVLVKLERYTEAVAIVEQLTADELAKMEKPSLALLYAEIGRFAAAADLLDNASETPSNHTTIGDSTAHDDAYWTAVQDVARRALKAGDSATAAELFIRMTAGAATTDIAAAGLFGRARCEWGDGHGDTAVAALDRLAERYPECRMAAEAAILRASILAETRGGDPALAALEQVASLHPGTPSAASALLRLGRMYEQASQDADAAAAYTRFIDEHAGATARPAAMLRCGVVLRRLGRAGEADDLLTSLSEEYPGVGAAKSARLLLARSAFDRQDFARARELVAVVLDSDVVGDSTAEALYLQGLIAAAAGDWIEVDISMRRLLAEYPQSEHRLSAEYWLAEAAYRRGELARAETLLDELIRKTHGRRERWVGMARLRRIQLLARERQWVNVIGRGETLLDDFPEFAHRYEVDYLLGRALEGQAEFQQAREAFARVVRSQQGARTETAAMSQWMIGESYFHQRDYGSARKAFLLVDAQFDDFPQWQAAALLEAGKCSGQLEDWDEAARLFDKVVQRFPESTHFDEANQRLRLAEQNAPSRRQARR